MDLNELGRRVKRLREERKLTQEELAGLMNMSDAYVSRLENGVVPNPKWLDLVKLTDTLGVPITALTGTGPTPDAVAFAEYLKGNPRLAESLGKMLRGYAWANVEDKALVASMIETLAQRLNGELGRETEGGDSG